MVDANRPRRTKRRWSRETAYVALGHICFAFGIVALLVPILPTTPFLVLAAACYARGSERFHNWLVTHRWFGPPILTMRQRRGLTFRAKVVAIGSSLFGLIGSLLLFAQQEWTQLVAVAVTCVFVILVLRLPTAK